MKDILILKVKNRKLGNTTLKNELEEFLYNNDIYDFTLKDDKKRKSKEMF